LLLSFLAVGALAGTDIIPSAEGNKWTYDCYKYMRGTMSLKDKVVSAFEDTSFGSSVYEIVSIDSKANPPTFDYRETTTTVSSSGGQSSESQVDIKFANTDKEQRIVSTNRAASADDDEPDQQEYSPALLYYLRDAAPGKQWTVGDMKQEDTVTPMSAKAVGKETVTVPAGTFKDCLKVVYYSDTVTGEVDIWGKPFTMASGKTRGIYWIADGVGVVKELEIAVSTAQAPGPDGKTMLSIESASCDVRELKPGYVVNK
jgi:hypothetical protein